MVHSLAFRKHEDDIRAGRPPEKYTRLLPHIPRGRILEVGSAEGVLALLLAERGDQVTALERCEARHEAAQQLYGDWLGRERQFKAPLFVNGSIGENLGLLGNKDTFVAVRAIYYFGDQLEDIFNEVARKVRNVVLCGNGNRANRWRMGNNEETKADNYYASHEGMSALLKRHGYSIVNEVRQGDEIVVGRKD